MRRWRAAARRGRRATRRSRALAQAARDESGDDQPDGPDDRRRARGRDDRRVGRDAARGVRQLPRPHRRRRGQRRRAPTASSPSCAREVARLQEQLGRRPKILVGKPGLDGHSNGAEQIAVRARDAGMDVVYDGHPPDARADRRLGAAGGRPRDRPVDPLRLAPRADPGGDRGAARARRAGAGGRRRHHPRAGRAPTCCQAGAAAVYTPKDFDITRIMREIVALLAAEAERPALAAGSALRVSADGAALAARLRERDLSAAPGGAEPAREQRARGPRAGRLRCSPSSPRRTLGERGAGARDRRHRAARGGQVDDALGAAGGLAARGADGRDAGRGPELAPLGRVAARATARGSTSTPPTAAC